MLEDDRERDHGSAVEPVVQYLEAFSDAIVGAPGYHLFHIVLPRELLNQLDVQPLLSVEPSLHRGIVASELKLVRPFQLENYGFAFRGHGFRFFALCAGCRGQGKKDEQRYCRDNDSAQRFGNAGSKCGLQS